MPDFVVDAAASLETFLRKQPVQPWRVPILLRTGALTVLRNSARVSPVTHKMALRIGDVVRIADPLPPAAERAFQRQANTDARAIAFVPGTTAYDKKMATLMTLRPRTTLVVDPAIATLRAFLAAMHGGALAKHPISDIVVASHANAEGALALPMDAGVPQPPATTVSYEDLEALAKARSLVVDPAALEPRPQDANRQPVQARLLVHGCRIGAAPPFLRKLKEALGNTLVVVAPKHYHVVGGHNRPDGAVEYLAYGFRVASPAPLPDKAAVVKAFAGGGFTRIDNKPVPPRLWPDWVPDDVTTTKSMPGRAVSPVTGKREGFFAEFQVNHRSLFDQEQWATTPGRKDPGTDDARIKAVADHLAAQDPRFRNAHPFPIWQRFGQASMDELVKTWTWTVRWDSAAAVVRYRAERVDYIVIQPLVDPATNRLFMNFYPRGDRKRAVRLLHQGDARFFEAV